MDIDRLVKIFGDLDCTNCGDAEAVAQYTIGNLIGYRSASTHRREDVEFLARAVQAYARLVQQAGVKA
jgi:hypothetical protein